MFNDKNYVVNTQSINQNKLINCGQEKEDSLINDKPNTYLETPNFSKDSQSKSSCLFFYKDVDSKDNIIKSNFGLTLLEDKQQGEKERFRSFHNPKTKSFDVQIPNNILSRELFEKRKSVFEPLSNNQSFSSFLKKSKDNSNTTSSSLIFDTLPSIKINNNGKANAVQEENKPLFDYLDVDNHTNIKANKINNYQIMRQDGLNVCNNTSEVCTLKEIIQLSYEKKKINKNWSNINEHKLQKENILDLIIMGSQSNQRVINNSIQRESFESLMHKHVENDFIYSNNDGISLINEQTNLRKTLKRSTKDTNLNVDHNDCFDNQIDYSKITKRKRCKEIKDYKIFLSNQVVLNESKPITDQREEKFVQNDLNHSSCNNENMIEQTKTSLSRNNSCCKDNWNDNVNRDPMTNCNNDYCIMLPNNNDNGLVTFKAEQIKQIFSAVNKNNSRVRSHSKEKMLTSTTSVNTHYSHNTIDNINNKHNTVHLKPNADLKRNNYQITQKKKYKTKRLSHERIQKPTVYVNPKMIKNQKNNNTKPLENTNYIINQFDGNPIFSYHKDDTNNNLSPYCAPKTIKNKTEQPLYQLLIEIQKKCIDNNALFQLKENELKNEIEFLKSRINSLILKELEYQNQIKQLSTSFKQKQIGKNMNYQNQMSKEEDNEIEIKLNMMKSNTEYSNVLNDNKSMKELFNYLFDKIETVRTIKEK